ncbi:MAG TPA: dioxygenase [Vicinamibacterales bacterium]|nr:dioxygenase [Vicinamibacterales bacterium]
MRNTTEHNITSLATERYSVTPDPRLREVITSLVKHLHGFIRDVEPTEAEWMTGIDFLTRVGKMCDDKRQEFILMSDVLGVSILVDSINHRLPDKATPSTVVGPFHIPDSPPFDSGANMAVGAPGVPLILTGTVRSLEGNPIPNAVVDVWQPDGEGVYEAQLPDQQGSYLRGVYRTDKDGRYVIRTVAPIGYTIPLDGPVGALVTRTTISPYRPTHVHFEVSADGFSSVITHIFRNGDAHLDNDVVFAVKDRLVVDFADHPPGVAPNGERMTVPYCTANFDFVLAPVAVGVMSA